MQKKTIIATEARSPKQQRALLTRQQLIAAARTTFAEQGFEHASIEDIAAAAGKTRGAFYANFANKEEVFFAIFDEDITHDQAVIRPLLQSYGTADERMDALATHLTELCHNRERTMLQLEFKQYAIRHPSKRERLAELHGRMRARFNLPEIEEFMPELAVRTEGAKRACSLAIGGTLEGLSLNHLFDPLDFNAEQTRHYLRACLQAAIFPEAGEPLMVSQRSMEAPLAPKH